MLCLAQVLGNTPLTTSRQHNCNLHAMLGTPHTEHAFKRPTDSLCYFAAAAAAAAACRKHRHIYSMTARTVGAFAPS
jgi:hypothetical protein